MKKIGNIVFACILFLTTITIVRPAIAQTVKGENQFSDYYLITVPIPDVFPPLKTTLIETVARLVSYSQIKGQNMQLPDIAKTAQGNDTAAWITMPKMVQDRYISKTQESGPAAEMAGKACVYNASSGDLAAEVEAKENTVKSDTVIDTILRWLRGGAEWFDTIKARNTITMTNGKYDQREPVYAIDKENQQPCSKRIPGESTKQITDKSKDRAKWPQGIGKPLVELLEEFCGVCDCCTDYIINVDKTILQSNVKAAYLHTVGGSSTQTLEGEKVYYPVDKNLVERTAGKGGWADTHRPSLFELFWKAVQSILGQTSAQAFETDGFGDRVSNTAWDFLNAIKTGDEFAYCTMLPKSTQTSFFPNNECEKVKPKEGTTEPGQQMPASGTLRGGTSQLPYSSIEPYSVRALPQQNWSTPSQNRCGSCTSANDVCGSRGFQPTPNRNCSFSANNIQAPATLQNLMAQSGSYYGIPPQMLAAVMWVETASRGYSLTDQQINQYSQPGSYDPMYCNTSTNAGASGPMQISIKSCNYAGHENAVDNWKVWCDYRWAANAVRNAGNTYAPNPSNYSDALSVSSFFIQHRANIPDGCNAQWNRALIDETIHRYFGTGFDTPRPYLYNLATTYKDQIGIDVSKYPSGQISYAEFVRAYMEAHGAYSRQ